MATAPSATHAVGGTPAEPDDINSNFDQIEDFLNDDVVHSDGAVAMTGALELPAADPTTSNQATRKSYVDDNDPTNAQKLTLITGANTGVAAAGGYFLELEVADPGYNLEVWGTGMCIATPATIGDIANIWSLGIHLNEVAIRVLAIPFVTASQSIAVPIFRHAAATGAGTGTAGAHRYRLHLARAGGTQASVTVITNTFYQGIDLFYRKA